MLVIVSGLPGSGKSYFASRLAKRLGAVYLTSDKTRRAMNAMGKYAFDDKLNVYEEMARKAGENLRGGKTVVVDATFYRREMREIFKTLATLLHKPICYVEVRAEENLIKKRLSKPRPDSEADYTIYSQLKPQYDEPADPRLILESTDDNINAMLRQSTDYITRMNERDSN